MSYKILIDGQEVDLPNIEDFPFTVSYSIEDKDNFQRKTSSTAFNIPIPATTKNDKISNSFHNPSSEDYTPGQIFRNNRKAVISFAGQELLVGKAFLLTAGHDSCPIEYIYNFYGNNGDWIVDLKEATLYDYLKDLTFILSKDIIVNSWGFDGRNPNLPYVFAPVRYGVPMDTVQDIVDNEPTNIKLDYNMKPIYMKPALSKYWILYNAFKSLGYTIKSDFLDSDYFRRQVMPWTWGNFLYSDGTKLDNLDFLVKSSEEVELLNQSYTGFWDMKVTNETTNGCFDNNGVYDYLVPSMTWTYIPAFNYGLLTATFHVAIYLDAVATANSDVEVRIQWFKNGVKFNNGDDNGNGSLLLNLNAPSVGRKAFIGVVDNYCTVNVTVNDIISAKIYLHTFKSGAGIARIHGSIDAFELDYFRIPLGGTIDFANYTGFKKFKILDLLAGIIDEFNLCIGTDPVTKTVYIEPQHAFSLVNDQSEKAGGYYNGKYLDWSDKQDLSKRSDLDLYSDSERELIFKYKDDTNDGNLKIVQDRNLNTLGLAKYVLPDRFKAGKKEVENRFFSASVHYDVNQWRGLQSDYPQMMCLIPENIANTSREEAQNTFEPKSAYYKGMIPNTGWVFDGEVLFAFPFMFSVNYRDGGEDDPILSYCDEVIGSDGSDTKLGKGLMRRFYLQRLAIMANGQYYKTYFHLDNKDIANILHREHIICRGQKWELVEINNYSPAMSDSTEVLLKKWSPIRSA